MEKIRNAEIYEKFKTGVSADDIAQSEGISRARVYQIISSMKAKERVADLPLIDDSKVVKELNAEIQYLKEQVKRLEKVIDHLLAK